MKFYNGLKGMNFEMPNGTYSQPLAFIYKSLRDKYLLLNSLFLTIYLDTKSIVFTRIKRTLTQKIRFRWKYKDLFVIFKLNLLLIGQNVITDW